MSDRACSGGCSIVETAFTIGSRGTINGVEVMIQTYFARRTQYTFGYGSSAFDFVISTGWAFMLDAANTIGVDWA